MTGALKAKVAGQWVPVGVPGPSGQDGPQGPPAAAAKQVARAFTCRFATNYLASGVNSYLIPQAPALLNDGFTMPIPQDPAAVTAIAAGRFLVAAHVTIVNGTVGNWVIGAIQRRNAAGTQVSWYDVVAQNVSAGYRMVVVSSVMDLDAGDTIRVGVQADVSSPQVDSRSWLTIAEVAW